MPAVVPNSDSVQMQVQVPIGVGPGQTLQVRAPSGQIVELVVPQGAAPGSVFIALVPGSVSAANEDEYEAYEPLPDIRYDVTDPFESVCGCIFCPCLGYTTRQLILSDQEVTLQNTNLCGASKQKRPYAQLGSVDKHTTKCGCHAISSNFAPVDENGEGGIKVGCCGSDAQTTEKIVAELQLRKGKRGGIAQIRKLDYVIGKMVTIGTKIPLMLYKLGIQFTRKNAPKAEGNPLDIKTIDVSNYIEMLCGCTTKKLTMDQNEATLEISQCLGCKEIKSRREYGELGFVEKRKNCVCCFSVASDISPIPEQGAMQPGCPCTNRSKVTGIVSELRERMAVRGQVGQIRKQEKILGMVADTEEYLQAFVQHEQIAYPPSRQEMTALYGPDAPDLNAERPPIESVDDKTWDVTSTIDSLLTCCCTCGIAGFTTETMELYNDVMYVKVKNRLDDSDMKIPYAEMNSVDVSRACYCCYAVNEQNPGLGCEKTKVDDIAKDLQERKFKRGNIAHLKQLRNMQVTAVGLNVMANLLLQNAKMQYPPSQQAMDAIFPGKKPRALTHEQRPHIEVEKEFEKKVYNVTSYPGAICSCLFCPCGGWTTQNLELGPDEMVTVTENCCLTSHSRVPYGNMGAVETETFLCCCVGLPEIALPGCGCSKDLVDEIAGELQERKVKRGNIAQMKQQENIIIEVLNLEAKVDMLAHKYDIQYPPSPEVMAELFTS